MGILPGRYERNGLPGLEEGITIAKVPGKPRDLGPKWKRTAFELFQ